MKYLMIDIEGIDLNENDVRRIQHPHVGGVILFSRNYVNKYQLTQLIQTMREVKEELLIAVDYEGGRVQRFREEFTLLPSMRTLGNLFDDNEFRLANSALLRYTHCSMDTPVTSQIVF